MRTRHRGQKKSIVSSLGLGPRQNRHRCASDLSSTIEVKRRFAVGAQCLKSRLSSQAPSAGVARHVGRPRIRRRGSRGLRGRSRLLSSVLLDSESSDLSSNSTLHSVYATRTRNKNGLISMMGNTLSSSGRIWNSKDDESTKVCSVLSKRMTVSRGAKRGRPRFSSVFSRVPVFDRSAHSSVNPPTFLDSKCDSPVSDEPAVKCLELKDAVKCGEVKNFGCKSPTDYKLDIPSIKKDDFIFDTLPVPAKRRRGRPSLKSYSAATLKVDSPVKLSENKEHAFEDLHDSASLHSEFTKENDFTSRNLVRVSCTSSPTLLHFGATDDVLQEVLNEVNVSGFVNLPIKRTRKGLHNLSTFGKIDENHLAMSFDSASVEKIFNSICDEGNLNEELASKDLFLAMNGLLRPGVCEVWRRRREDRSKQLSRDSLGRLRPNPRPRRYSDMISQGSRNSHVDGLISLESGKLLHQSARPGIVSAARLTAAKKLIRAKSHIQGGLQISSIRSQDPDFVDELCGQKSAHLDRRTGKNALRATKMTVSVSSRTTRHPDVSHHIDWKFCYASSSKSGDVTSVSNDIQRRPHQANLTPKGKIEGVGDISPSRSIDDGSHNSELDDLKESCDIHTAETSEQSAFKSENVTDIRNNSTYFDMFGINRNSSMLLTDEQLLERQRKRRRVIAFQRKRPNERFLTYHKERQYLGKGHSRDDSSASSSTSIIDAYGRSFRQARRWFHHHPSKHMHSERMELSYDCHSRFKSRIPQESEQSVNSRGTHSVPNLSYPRVTPELIPIPETRSRPPRRSDRMCQLTLLDRLVLGLNCSVSQNEDEIHIKQLHSNELNILTQRMCRTGFFIQSLALRQNANNDAEYNIVLTFSSENEPSTRRTRCPNSLLRSKSDLCERALSCRSSSVSDETLWNKVKNQSCPKGISCLASRNACQSSPRYTNMCHLSKESNNSSSLSGYQSDSGLYMKRTARYVREFHSDSEDSDFQHQRYFEKLNLSRKTRSRVLRSPDNKLSHTHPTSGSVDKSRHTQICSSSGTSKVEIQRCQQLENDPTVSNVEASKRPTALSRISPMKEDVQDSAASEESSDIHGNSSLSFSANSCSHGLSKREANVYAAGAVQCLPFRRHSPRKVIRKVYTGSLTIPKILNRKRIPGVNTSQISGPSVTMSVTSTNSSLATSSSVSAISGTTDNSSGHSSTSTSAVAIHETQSMPMYSAANQFTMLQATATSLGIVQNPVASMEQTKVTVSTLTAIPSIISDSLSTISAKLNDGDTNSTINDPFKEAEIEVSVSLADYGDSNADHPISCVVSERVVENGCECSVITENSSGENDSVMDTPQLDVGKNVCPTETVASESDMKDDAESLTVSSDVCSTSNIPHSVISVGASHVPPFTNSMNNDEFILGTDDSHTPAKSLSASQLLKLKRLHDETGRSVCRRDSRSHCSSQASSIHPARTQNQSQPPESETSFTQCLQSSQFQQSQQSMQCNSSMPPSTSGTNFDSRSFPFHLNHDLSTKTNPRLEIDDDDDDDDTEDFELKNLTRVYEPSLSNSFQPTSVPTHRLTSNRFFDNNPSSLSTFQTTIPMEPQNLPFMNAHYPALIRAPRTSWPVKRPTLNPAFPTSLRLQSHCYNPVTSTVLCFPETDQSTSNRNINQSLTSPRVSAVENVSDQLFLSSKSFVSPSSPPVSTVSSEISVTTTVQSPTNVSVCSPALKRTVVHKYHSFRKILPKADRPIMLPTTPGFSVSPFGANTVGLGRFSVPKPSFGVFTSEVVTTNAVLPCEVATDGTFIMDLGATSVAGDGSSIPISRNLCATSLTLVSSSSSVLATNPASQLLKSLLERDDSRSNSVTATNTMPFTLPTIVSTTSLTSVSGSPLWNQPAHQSRGTWQLGKRAVNSAQRSPPDTPCSKLSQTNLSAAATSTTLSTPAGSSATLRTRLLEQTGCCRQRINDTHHVSPFLAFSFDMERKL
uniref:Uncharacterized protein n=1 Tax=Trichobilharzia regenti TaxID=157069 RepID=A0AA85J433_TRIRE|nr:unnamed protein product [Trichobilharzia regenti]